MYEFCQSECRNIYISGFSDMLGSILPDFAARCKPRTRFLLSLAFAHWILFHRSRRALASSGRLALPFPLVILLPIVFEFSCRFLGTASPHHPEYEIAAKWIGLPARRFLVRRIPPPLQYVRRSPCKYSHTFRALASIALDPLRFYPMKTPPLVVVQIRSCWF